MITEILTPLLLKSSNPRLIYISSSLGSITERSDPNNEAYQAEYSEYRMSKAALNMLAACKYKEFEGKVKVWAFNPGYVVTNLSGTGEKGIEERKKNGAGDPRQSAEAIVGIVGGKRDADVGGFIGVEGGVMSSARHAW